MKREVNLEKEECVKKGTLMAGRRSLLMLYQSLATDIDLTELHDYEDIMDLECKGPNDLKRFWKEWRETLQKPTTDSMRARESG